MPKYSEKSQDVIAQKMHKMKGEKISQDQKIAIAISEAKKKGLKAPENPNPGPQLENPKEIVSPEEMKTRENDRKRKKGRDIFWDKLKKKAQIYKELG